MYGKLIENKIIYAPSVKNDIFNYNSEYNREMLLEDGWKPVILAERIDGHFYTSSYRETNTQIREILEDITDEVKKQEKIQEIQQRISELKEVSLEEIRLNHTNSIEIINDIITGLEKTKEELEDVDNN